MTVYRAKSNFTVEISRGIEVSVAYGDLVDFSEGVLSSLQAQGLIEWTDFAIPENDPVSDAEYLRIQAENSPIQPDPVVEE